MIKMIVLKLSPKREVSVATHPDSFQDPDAVRKAFLNFVMADETLGVWTTRKLLSLLFNLSLSLLLFISEL